MSSIIASRSRSPADAGHRRGRVVELLDAHRLRQPRGRVDGEDDDLAAALGGPQRSGRDVVVLPTRPSRSRR
jgi:hypothetical protein